MTDQEQVDGLYAVQGFDHELEAQLSDARVLSVRPFDTARVHISTTYELVLDSGHLCIFKPADGLLKVAANGVYLGKQALVRYDHTPVSTTIAECAAWQLAKQLGAPWSELVVPTVMKFPRHPETNAAMVGAASVFRGGGVGKRGFYAAVADQVSAAAFFDALIGQQDPKHGQRPLVRGAAGHLPHRPLVQLCASGCESRRLRSRAVALGPRLPRSHRGRNRCARKGARVA